MLKEEVDEEDIAEVISKWTGVPISRMLEGEIQKLLKWKKGSGLRVVWEDEAIGAASNAVRRSRAGHIIVAGFKAYDVAPVVISGGYIYVVNNGGAGGADSYRQRLY